MATLMSCTSCEASTSDGSTSQVFRILPRNGMTAWNSRSRACLAEPPAESPSTRNSSVRLGSWRVQSASLPGSAGPVTTRLRTTLRLALSRALGVGDRQLGNAVRRPPGCWFSHRANASLTTPDTNAAHSREDSRSLVWPENCGSSILTDSTKATASQTSSGASLHAARQQVAELAELAQRLGQAGAQSR